MEKEHSQLDRIIEKQRIAHPWMQSAGTIALRTLLTVVSPTWGIASLLKPTDDGKRSMVIVGLNVFYLSVALGTVAGLAYHFDNDLYPIRALPRAGWWAWAYFLWSRCAEVLIAFYRDAMDRLKGRPSKSDLTGSWRVWLALNSYVELIIDYALLYALLPANMWVAAPTAITDTLWISASTITTSGGGGFVPKHYVPQLLSTLEIFGGVILLVVCFALYAGGKSGGGRGAGATTPTEERIAALNDHGDVEPHS